MIFFTDRDLGSLFPKILLDAGIQVETYNDHFKDNDTSDEIWLSEVGRNKWFAISKDRRIRYRPNERLAVMRAGVGLFIVIGTNATHQELAKNFVASYQKIEAFLEKHNPPFIAKVYRPSAKGSQGRNQAGRIELWYPPQQ